MLNNYFGLRLLLLLWLTTGWLGASGQGYNNNWYFGTQAGLSFSGGSPTPLTNGQFVSYEGCASISNGAGVLQAYSNGINIWNRNHQVMPNGASMGGHESASQCSMFLPYPGDPTKFVFLIVDAIDNNMIYGLRYSVLDMTLQSGLGDVTATRNVRLPTPTLAGKVTEKLTAALHANGRDYWIIVKGWQNNEFYSFLLSPSGISSTPVVSAVGPVHQGGGSFFGAGNAVGYMRVSPNGQWLALAQRDNEFALHNFDNATGTVSNYVSLGFAGYNYGVEFSPNSSRLYCSASPGGSIRQYNLQAGTLAQIAASRVSIYSGDISGLQRGPDGKIYGAMLFNNALSVINNPDALGTACNLSVGTVGLGGRQSQNGLPNFPNAFPLVVNEWTGAVSTTYTDAANWSANYVPGATDDVTIPATAVRMPVLSAAASAASFTVASGASMTVATGGDLTLARSLTNNGTFGGDGTVRMGASGTTQLLGTAPVRIGSLTVGGSLANIVQDLDVQTPLSITRVLTLGGNLTMSGSGTLTLISDAAGTAMVVNNGAAAVSGRVTVQRYLDPSLNAGLGYRHLASPVSSTTLNDLATAAFAPAFNPAYNVSTRPGTVTPFPTVFGYDQTRLSTSPATGMSDFDKGWASPNGSGDAMLAGQGYTVNLAAGQVVDFVGQLGNGSLTVTGLGRGPQAEAGWHLLGNPYPAPISWSALFANTTGLNNAVHVYKSSGQYTGSYASFVNGVGANGGSNVIALGQAFFVRTAAVGGTGSVSFSNAARLTSYQNPALNRGQETRPLLALELRSSAGQRDEAVLYAETGATAGFDGAFDAYKVGTGGHPALSLPVGTEELTINGLPDLGTSSQTIPLTVRVPAAGIYTLASPALLNLPAGARIWLHDALTGGRTLLTAQATYSFTAPAAATFAGRFTLVIEPARPTAAAAALARQVSVYPNPAHGQLWVTVPAQFGQQAVRVTLLNALGQPVLTQTLPAGRSGATLTMPATLAKGVYSLHLHLPEAEVAKRVVIE
jgi:Secretion system C-terminal sorting domain